MHALHHAGALEVKDGLPLFGAVLGGKDKLGLACAGDVHFHIAVYVAVGMAGDGDGRLPGADRGMHSADQDGRTEHCAVQHGADGAVGAFPHFMQVIFLHALGVGGDGGTLHRYTVLFRGVGAVNGHLIPGFVPVGQAQVIIFGFQINIRQNQQILDVLPQDAGHFIAVHLYKRRCHFDFFHGCRSFAILYPGSTTLLYRTEQRDARPEQQKNIRNQFATMYEIP